MAKSSKIHGLSKEVDLENIVRRIK
jgi:hypothetical protein